MLIPEEIVKAGKASLLKGDTYSSLDLREWDDQ